MPAIETESGAVATDSELLLPPDAHIRIMELLKTPPRERVVAVMPHRGLHDTQPAHSQDSDIGEHTRASMRNAPAHGYGLLEIDVKDLWMAHGETWGPTADFGSSKGLAPFNLTDYTSNQDEVNPLVKGSDWELVKDAKLRGASGAATDESPLNITAALQLLVDEKLPVVLVLDCKTPDDELKVPYILAGTKDSDGIELIDRAIVKLQLTHFPTVAAYDEAFGKPGPDGKPIGDSLNVVWVVSPNDVQTFGSEQAIIDALAAHRATGRFSITELNIKDDKGLHEVAKWVRESGQVWLGSYHPTREFDLRHARDEPLVKLDWNKVTDKETLHAIGELEVLLWPDGRCCHKINSDLRGSEFDQRVSATRLMELGSNFIVTDTPNEVRNFFRAQGIPDISDVVMRLPQLNGNPEAAPGWSGPDKIAAAGLVFIAGSLTYQLLRSRRAKMGITAVLRGALQLGNRARDFVGYGPTGNADLEATHLMEMPQRNPDSSDSVSDHRPPPKPSASSLHGPQDDRQRSPSRGHQK